jgi:hypothetical protein
MFRRTCALACALALSTAIPAPAAVPPVIVVTSVAFTYVPGDLTDPTTSIPLQVPQGATVEFAPMDALGNHTITSVDWVGGAPLFTSELIGPGQVSEVVGVPSLGPGIYEFSCNAHYFMHGALEIVEHL